MISSYLVIFCFYLCFFVDLTFLINIVSKACNLCRLVLSFFYLDYCKLCVSAKCVHHYERKQKKDVFSHFYFVARGWFRTAASSGMSIFVTMINDLLPSAVVAEIPSRGLWWSWFRSCLCLLVEAELRRIV